MFNALRLLSVCVYVFDKLAVYGLHLRIARVYRLFMRLEIPFENLQLRVYG